MSKELDCPTCEYYEEKECVCDKRPCPDDEEYICYGCGEPTGRGYDSGLCAQCLGE